MSITKQHDEFARKYLNNLEAGKEFLETYLHPEIKYKCNLNTISISSGSYVEDDLKAHVADIVYKVDLNDNPAGCAYIYTLVEHQSTQIELMPFRILRYQIAIIQKHIQEYPKDKLPLVVPIVFYNGTTSPYNKPTELAELFADGELFKQIGLGNFKLTDLTVTHDDEILQHKKISLLELLLKHIHDRDLKAIIDSIIQGFKLAELYHVNPSLIQAAISYLLNGRERNELNPLIEKLKQNLPKYGDDIMTYAEELRQEGIQIGEQRGEQRGVKLGEQKAQFEIAKELLKKGVDREIVLSTTHLSNEQILQLK